MRNRKSKPKVRDIRATAEAAAEQLKAQEPKVTFISRWLAWRTNENGFGEDFDITIVPKGAR